MDKCNSWTEYENKLNEIVKVITERHKNTQCIGLYEQETAEISNVLLNDLPALIEHNNFEALRLVGNILDVITEYVDCEDLNTNDE